MVMSSTYRSFFVTFRQPSDDDRDVFSAQLAPESWLAVAATVVALQVVMAAFASASKTKKKNSGKYEMESGFGKLDRLTWTWTALAQAGVVNKTFFFLAICCKVAYSSGHDPAPDRWSQRAVFLVGFLFALMIYNYFTANIISSLQTSKAISSVQEAN